jgi:hypothetical protein
MAKRLSAVVGEYTDKQSGQQKADWANIGIIGVSQKGKEYMLLDPTVNLAGVLLKQNVLAANKGEKLSDMVMISIIEDNNNQQQGQNNNQQQQGMQQQQSGHQQQQQGFNQNTGFQQR